MRTLNGHGITAGQLPAAPESGPPALRLTAALADGWLPSVGRTGLQGAAELRSAVLSGLR